MTVFTDVDKKKLAAFKQVDVKNIYEESRYNHQGVSIILYRSGKLLLQGKQEAVDKVAALITGRVSKPEIFRREEGWVIGSDETLKGDTFGGLVVAAVRADAAARIKLQELGVADSKLLQDSEIVVIADRIKKVVGCSIHSILPEEYNRLGKITDMLNEFHGLVRKELGSGLHVVDKYPGCSVGDIIEIKAESKYIEVAAASILARAAGLRQFDYLSGLAGFTLPKGSTHVKEALVKMKSSGLNSKKFVKISFRNVQEFL